MKNGSAEIFHMNPRKILIAGADRPASKKPKGGQHCRKHASRFFQYDSQPWNGHTDSRCGGAVRFTLPCLADPGQKLICRRGRLGDLLLSPVAINSDCRGGTKKTWFQLCAVQCVN